MDLLTLSSQMPKCINNPIRQTAGCYSRLICKRLTQIHREAYLAHHRSADTYNTYHSMITAST